MMKYDDLEPKVYVQLNDRQTALLGVDGVFATFSENAYRGSYTAWGNMTTIATPTAGFTFSDTQRLIKQCVQNYRRRYARGQNNTTR